MGLLQGETAIITGAASGIGRAIAHMFAKEGAQVFAADLNREAVLDTAAAIERTTGIGTVGFEMDVSCEANVTAAVEKCISSFGKVSILVNCAGIYLNSALLKTTKTAWERVFKVNVTGTFLMTQAAARAMVPRGHGKIINISSCSARKPDIGQAAYNASKSAIVGLTRVTALELGPDGIYCNVVLPGATDTEMTRSTFLTSPEVEKQWINKTALKRLGKPEDIASAVLFLASPLSDHITGESLVVSAGELMTQ